ncbi:hypothetical protein C8F04DRAFT_1099826 [Mycena alexandri]|uniref:F-box domain-containing protein n=1 Tax=Mycena alexandri TaxID=1745969 RepID=A0AAD6SWJ9_9AGAR|nr:hypothetical protein C8F04DRAFT_1099826 [Mycena alexandri]
MALTLLTLPEDILLSILLFLRAEDILILSQTCRVLHEFTANDYLWHTIATHYPALDIAPYVDRNDLSGPALQAIVTRALSVDHNWRKTSPRMQLARLVDLDGVSQMQFVGSHWLVVLRRSSLSVWRVADTTEAYLAAAIDLPGPAVPLKFAAAMQRGCKEVLIAVISPSKSGTLLSAYTAFLKSQRDDANILPSLRCSIYKPQSEGRFYEVHVRGSLIAAGIPQFIDGVLSPGAYRILFINYMTSVQCLVDPQLPQEFTQLHFQISLTQLVLAGVCNQSSLVVRTHDLPASVVATSPLVSESVESLTTPNAEYESPPISDLDYILSADSTHDLPHISSISFHSLVRMADGYIVHFPLHSKDKTPCFAHPLNTHPASSAEIVCLGQTGSRAVWLERRWGSDEYMLMKAAFSPEGENPVVVEPLLARHMALPFQLHMCQALAFDEATGRVALAVHTGELHLLQF